MKTSQLITRLQNHLDFHGDMELVFYDKKTTKPVVGFLLHAVLYLGYLESSKDDSVIIDFTESLLPPLKAVKNE